MIELDTYPIMVVMSEQNRIKYSWYTEDFPYKYFVEHGSKKLPRLTAASDYFNLGVRYDEAEEVEASGWFRLYNEELEGVTFYEKCIYQSKADRVISILWQ